MYAEHQPRIAAHAATPEGFADVATLAIASQNQHFHRVGTVLDSLQSDGLDCCKYLHATQKRGIAYVRQHSSELRTRLEHGDAVEQLKVLIEIPAIGIVKAGFILHMVCGRVGCLDRHNLRTAGLSLSAFDRIPQNTESLTQRLWTYVLTCQQLGSPAQLWNGWCSLIATKYPQQFSSAEEVSYKHVEWTRS